MLLALLTLLVVSLTAVVTEAWTCGAGEVDVVFASGFELDEESTSVVDLVDCSSTVTAESDCGAVASELTATSKSIMTALFLSGRSSYNKFVEEISGFAIPPVCHSR
jgi:hypothetical protein